MCRSREGAWIEILDVSASMRKRVGRSREGAWIEIPSCDILVTWKIGRSREGAWIEIVLPNLSLKAE